MKWEVITTIICIAGLNIALFNFFDNRLDDFKELFKSELSSIRSEMKSDKELLRAELKLVHETLNNHINSEIKANRDEVKALDQKMDKGFNELKELIKRSKD